MLLEGERGRWLFLELVVMSFECVLWAGELVWRRGICAFGLQSGHQKMEVELDLSTACWA